MTIIDPQTPMFNSIIFYIIIVTILILAKPKFMYSTKTKKFKSFGCKKGQTLLSFPVVSITSAFALYLIFLFVQVISSHLTKS